MTALHHTPARDRRWLFQSRADISVQAELHWTRTQLLPLSPPGTHRDWSAHIRRRGHHGTGRAGRRARLPIRAHVPAPPVVVVQYMYSSYSSTVVSMESSQVWTDAATRGRLIHGLFVRERKS